MDKTNEHHLFINQFLLGELSEEERQQFEEQWFDQDDFFQEVLAAEDDLIDAYVRGTLSSQQRTRFEAQFLNSPQQRQRVEFAKALHKKVQPVPVPSPVLVKPTPWWSFLQTWLKPQFPAWQWSLAACSLVLVFGSSWLVMKTMHLRNQLEQAQSNQQILLRQKEALEQQLAQQRTHEAQVTTELEREREHTQHLSQELAQQKTPPAQPAQPTFLWLSFVLSPRVIRDMAQTQPLVIPKEHLWVQLQLNLKKDFHYQNYRVEVQTVEGSTVWSKERLKATPTPDGKAVFCRIPTSVLSENDYILTLTGLPASPDSEEDYQFRIQRR